jgi:tetratricopeptide (TPR) repeat protein
MGLTAGAACHSVCHAGGTVCIPAPRCCLLGIERRPARQRGTAAALRIKPDSGDIYFHRGVAWSNSYYNRGRKPGDFQKAIDDYTRSIEIEPEFAEGYFQRAGLLSEQGQVEEAIADYSKAIEKNHKASSAYFCRAPLWQSTGGAGIAKAIADFDGAIRTGDEDDQFMALMARGEAHHGLGNLELALADFNAAAAYYPKGPPGLYEKRAAILLELGRAREAIVDLGEGIAAASPLADPRFIANMYEQRGQCRMQLGETHLAQLLATGLSCICVALGKQCAPCLPQSSV